MRLKSRLKSVLFPILMAAAVAGCGYSGGQKAQPSSETSAKAAPAAGAAAPSGATTTNGAPQMHKLASGLQYTDDVVGNGKMADPGVTAAVHYTGWLMDGTKFDSSKDRGQPFSFTLGAGQVIKGWDEGVKGMRIGGKRTLIIPPDMGYGAAGAGGVIPPNATLKFEVELLDVR